MLIPKILLDLYFTACYAAGGQWGTWIRRYFGGIGFGLGVIALSILSRKFGALVLIGASWYCPSMIIIPYGQKYHKDVLWRKVALRAAYGASLGLGSLLVGIGAGKAGLGLFQAVLATAGSVYFGVVNPFARWGNKGVMLEDAFLILSAVGLVPFFFGWV